MNYYAKLLQQPKTEYLNSLGSGYYADLLREKYNEKDKWITVKGNHIPIKEGQTKQEAVKEFIEKQKGKDMPKDEEGKTEKVIETVTLKDIKEISSKIDFTKNNILPPINIRDTDFKDLPVKPVLLKAEVAGRNKKQHPDISEEKAKEILAKALYKRDKIIPSTNENKPDYYNFTAFVDNYNYLVLLDFAPTKEYNEVVHYFIMSQKSLGSLIKKALKQGKNIWEKK